MMELLYLLIKAALLAVFMTGLTPLKYGKKASYAIIAAGHILIWLLNFLLYALKDVAFLERAILLSAVLPAFICFSVVAKYKGFRVLFSLLTVSVFGMMCGFVTTLATLQFHNDRIGALFNVLCYSLIILFIFKIFRRPYFRMLEMLRKGWGLFCAVPFLLMIILYLLQYHPIPLQNRPENILLLGLIYLLIVAFYAIVYLNFENITHYYQLRQDRRLMLLQTEMQKKEYDAMQEKLSAIRIYRHDMRHHIQALHALLTENNLTEAERYLSKLSDRLSSIGIEQYCENYVVNVILSSYINRAREENITVTCEADIPADVGIEDLELGMIFSNAIENAVAACGRIEDPGHRKISIVCREHFGQLHIQISNTFAGTVDFDGDFPVTDRENHGIGTRSIAAIAEKYGGIFSFATENGFFVTTVIVNVCGEIQTRMSPAGLPVGESDRTVWPYRRGEA